MTANRCVRVALGDRGYEVIVAADLIGDSYRYLEPQVRGRRIAVVTDPWVKQHLLPAFEETLEQLSPGWACFVVPGGESAKSFDGIQNLLLEMLDAGIDRDCVLLAFGGGVVGDVGGFASALVMRGIELIQLPTTLMSPVDSSVGGKNGINTRHGKNLVGTFQQPKIVLNDVSVLRTLPEIELRAGYAEIVKCALLRGETEFQWLEDNLQRILAREQTALVEAIAMGVETKARIVSEDELDRGKRALVNLGHTFAHAFETQAGFGEFPHGHAVATGLVCAADLSARIDLLANEVALRIAEHVRRAGLPASLTELAAGSQWHSDAIQRSMLHDKKTVGGKINLVLLRALGDVFVSGDYPAEALSDTLLAAGAV
jgi:3-dehydroquinate synthase